MKFSDPNITFVTNILVGHSRKLGRQTSCSLWFQIFLSQARESGAGRNGRRIGQRSIPRGDRLIGRPQTVSSVRTARQMAVYCRATHEDLEESCPVCAVWNLFSATFSRRGADCGQPPCASIRGRHTRWRRFSMTDNRRPSMSGP